MRTVALLYFRLPPKELTARLPFELRFLAPDFIEWLDGTRLNRELRPETLSLLIELGRARIGGATVLSGVRLDHRYERHDLNGDYAELFQDTQYEPATVLNAVSAFEGRWSCTHCDRVAVSQIGPLEVQNINLEVDLQVAANDEVLLHSRYVGVAAQAGATVRPLAGRQDFVQLSAPSTVTLTRVFPLLAIGSACPGCGRITHDRSDKVEGGGPSDRATGLVINQDWPLTVAVEEGADLGQSFERLNWRGTVSRQARHVVGERVNLVENPSWQVGNSINVIRLKFLDALLGAGANLPDLLPLVADNSAPSFPLAT